MSALHFVSVPLVSTVSPLNVNPHPNPLLFKEREQVSTLSWFKPLNPCHLPTLKSDLTTQVIYALLFVISTEGRNLSDLHQPRCLGRFRFLGMTTWAVTDWSNILLVFSLLLFSWPFAPVIMPWSWYFSKHSLNRSECPNFFENLKLLIRNENSSSFLLLHVVLLKEAGQ